MQIAMVTSLHCCFLVSFLTYGLIIYSASVPSNADPVNDEFEKWIRENQQKYRTKAEKLERFAIFKTNYQFINSSNNDSGLSFKLGLNKFADMTNQEFLAKLSGYIRSSGEGSPTGFRYENVKAPSSIDWRTHGAVNPVKDQGECGSCWAFSTVSTIEGITKIKKGTLPSLSEQALVDCVTDCHACDGCRPDIAFKWVLQNGGLSADSDYSYKARNGTCNAAKVRNIAGVITGYQDVPSGNETALMNAVANQPVTVAIDSAGLFFQFYRSGIFKGPCGTNLDHAVTAVGYGGEGSKQYWIVKNSWGTSWGEDGYVRMWKDSGLESGVCGIALVCSYPIA